MISWMLKISFSGVPGSGRSSLAEEVRKILAIKSRVELLDEISRKNPFDDHLRSGFESQFFYLSTQINEENSRFYSPFDYLLCDQCVIDQWVSWLNTYEKQKEETRESLREHHRVMHTLFRFWINSYDIMFLIRVSGDVYRQRQKDERLRKIDGLNQQAREKLFLRVVAEENIRVLEIWNNTSVDEAALQMIQHIQEFQVTKQTPDWKESTVD